jgi:CO/xanthine dehydrogenase Mo-binding subunit
MIHTGGGNKTYGYNFSSVKVKINYDGTVNVYTGSADLGQGSHIVILQIVAEELGVPIDRLHLMPADTDSDVMCMGTHGSRVTFVAGNAAKLAAEHAKKQVFEIASSVLEANVDDLVMEKGEIYVKGSPKIKIGLEEITRKAYYDRRQKAVHGNVGHSIIGWGFYDDKASEMADSDTGYGNINPTYTFGAQGVELEVDSETGKVNIIRIVGAYDVGRVINRCAAEGQFFGGVLQGIGQALYEKMNISALGSVQESNFLDYKILSAVDAPKMTVRFIETVDPEGPFGAKGFGECPLIPTAPAIANAIYDATGLRFTEIPITSEKILLALKKTQDEKKGKQNV